MLLDVSKSLSPSVAQIVAEAVGTSVDQVSVAGGDSAISRYGGGAWASCGTAVGGEATLRAGRALKRNILALAGATPASSACSASGRSTTVAA